MSLIKLIDFKLLGDERGHLTVLEGNKNIPFEIKRVYYLTDTQPGVARGFHAHKALEQSRNVFQSIPKCRWCHGFGA